MCKAPEIVFNKNTDNIFNETQEMYLGEAIAETLEKNFRVVKDEEANCYLQKVGAKLVEHLPPTSLKFQFHIIDTPELNAFATAGGRIYITRKMVAFLRSESELAGILGHELGHAVVRHVATDISKQFKEILKMEKLGDREDIYRKYNELIDKRNTKRVSISRGHQDNQQLEADQIGVFSMVAAGYDPEGFSSAWNRLTEIEGKTGNSFTDFLGSTRPEEKRLREILNAIKTIPSECVDKNMSASKEFEQWQTYIVTTSEFARQEKLTAVVDKKTLSPYLRGDILHFQFSPDGQYIIAQDSSGINVLKREPFSFVFRIN
ncbi:MAG: M48 family metalloprotease, partial [Acidobacteriota bacterium]|nr:M48 family metalloprotease [Acidobacteriota bacterium]